MTVNSFSRVATRSPSCAILSEDSASDFIKLSYKMPRIVNDPTKEVCPSFEGEGWEFIRQLDIIAHQGPHPLTDDQVLQHIKDAWQLDHDVRVAAWNKQLEQDQAEQQVLEWQTHEEEEA